MRALRCAVVILFLALSSAGAMAELACGSGAENDRRVRALHQRTRAARSRIASLAAPRPILREGAFYLQADEETLPGQQLFDLEGTSLVFEARPERRFALRREALRYREPALAPVHDFQNGGRFIEHDLPFAFPFLGRSITKIYITAFNSIEFETPSEPGAFQMNTLEAGLLRRGVVSPLMMTNRKPGRLAYPQLFLDHGDGTLIVTWRSQAGEVFGYDVQAELRSDGTIVYSYRSMRKSGVAGAASMGWGTPIVSGGFDPEGVTRAHLGGVTDASGDVVPEVASKLRSMTDIVSVDVGRVEESELTSIRVRLAAPIDQTQLSEGDVLRYSFTWTNGSALLEVRRDGMRVSPNASPLWINEGSSARITAEGVELFVEQDDKVETNRSLFVSTFALPVTRRADAASLNTVRFTPVTRSLVTDLSTIAPGTELAAPILEPFVLGELDPFAVWERVQSAFAISNDAVDGVLIYQNMFTDLVFFAGAYATGGNPQVGGINRGSESVVAPREPSLMHMNHLTYGWNSGPQSSANVMLHEFGHRWLYFVSIDENGAASKVLNPTSAHPAGYVHTPAAFTVTGDAKESSVMGGGFFTREDDGRYRARSLNVGYSWADLYLMGLASPEEVTPWFYLADTEPALPLAYWPADGTVVSGEKRDVNLQQIVSVHGPRLPAAAASQKVFRAAFVLLTEPGQEPSVEEVAKMNEWRALFERNFSIATGGRAVVSTTFAPALRRRAVR
jgi:hypothetical protein